MTRKNINVISIAAAAALAVAVTAFLSPGWLKKKELPAMNLLFEDGLVFDNDGKFVYRFSGVYPRITRQGSVVVGIPSAEHGADGIQGILRMEKDGTVSINSKHYTHHDLTVDQDGNIYLLNAEESVSVGRKKAAFGAVVKLNALGEAVGRWSLGTHIGKLSKLLNHTFEPKSVVSVTDAEHAMGRPVGCGNCKEGEHLNSLQALPPNRVAEKIPAFSEGNILMGLPLNQHLLILDRNSFEVVWSMKLDRVGFFHTPHLTDDGTILVFVNTMVDEQGRPLKQSLLVEIDPLTKQTIWSYGIPRELYSPIDGSAVKLPNGNYLFSVVSGLAREINPQGETVWEWRNRRKSKPAEIYRIYRLNEKEKEAVMGFIKGGA